MSTRIGPLSSFALLFLLVWPTCPTGSPAAERPSGPSAGTTAQTPPPVQCIPSDAVICLQVTRPQALLELLAGKEMTQAVTSLPFYQSLLSQPKFQEFLNVIKFLETTLETDWRTGLGRLAGGGITVAVCPEDTVVAVVEAEDEAMLTRLHETLLTISRAEAQNQGQPEKVASREYAGVTAWTFDGKEAHALVGRRLFFANRPEGLKAMLDLRAAAPLRVGAGPDGKGLAAQPAFQAATRAAGPRAVATVFVNIKPLMSIPNIAALLEQQRKSPLAALTFAGITEPLRHSNWLALGLEIDSRTLTVRVSTDGKVVEPKGPAAFALPPQPSDGAWPNIAVPRRIAALSLYRDLHGFYAAKDTLFPERTSGLIFFENMMGIFFTGRDLTSEVLAETEPEIRIVVAEQQYDPAVGTPQVRLPAFAVVLRLCHPEQFGKVVEEAWQKAVGLINFTRGQKAQPGLIIDRAVQGETRYTVAYFSTVDVNDGTKLPTRYNLRPALAMPGPYVILSSTDGLARDVIDALSPRAGQTRAPLARTHSVLEIDGSQTASALQANRDTLVRGDMVKKGRSQPEAEAGIDMLITLVKLVDQVKLSIGTQEGLTQARLQMTLNLPQR
jgi:hypothetical protein